MPTTLLGIEIGGTKLQIVQGNTAGRIVARERFQVDRDAGGEGIREKIRAYALSLRRKPDAVGVGFGGPVDWRTGAICCSHQIEGWSEFPLGRWLRQLFRAPVAVDNDANTGAFGEAILGAGAGRDPVFYVTLGSGVGGGLVVGGSIYHGCQPGEAEIGHVRLDRDGTIVEARCSGWAVDRRIQAHVARHPRSLLARLTRGMSHGQARVLKAACRRGDAAATQILHDTASDLAFGLSHVVHLFHPTVIVLGGGLSLLGKPLQSRVRKALGGFIMDAFKPGPQVVLAGLGEDAVPIGALLLARRILK